MNTRAVKTYFSVKANRRTMINKIENGLKHKDISFSKDPEVENFQKGFLENWDNLENFPMATQDLEGLEGKAKKEKIEELKMQFCEWVSGADAIAEGYSYGYNRKEHIKEHVKGAGKSVVSKTKAAMSVLVGKNKIGRNDPCECGSGLKYKKCCGGNS